MQRPVQSQHHRETRLDAYVDRYAARTEEMTASEIRALFSVATRPEVVSLAGGMPNISGLPLDVVGATARRPGRRPRHRRHAVRLRAGRPGAARADLRRHAARGHPGAPRRRRGHGRHPAGGRPGDPDLLRSRRRRPLRGALLRRRAGRLPRLPVRRRARRDGRRRPAARRRCGRRSQRCRRPGSAPSSSTRSPTTTTRPASRCRQGAARRCSRSAGRPTCWCSRTTRTACSGSTRSRYRALRADDAEGVVYLGSFSKTFAPGFRVGWALAPHGDPGEAGAGPGVGDALPADLQPAGGVRLPVRARLARPDQGVPRACTASGATRCSTSLDELMPAGAQWTVPGGGFYVWLTLPEGLDAKAMLPRAVTARVAYVPGTAFYADGSGARACGCRTAIPTPERIREGVRRLAGGHRAGAGAARDLRRRRDRLRLPRATRPRNT